VWLLIENPGKTSPTSSLETSPSELMVNQVSSSLDIKSDLAIVDQSWEFDPHSDVLPLKTISLTSPVSPGQNVTLVIQAIPGAECKIVVDPKSLSNDFRSFHSQKADSDGKVTWTWTTGKSLGTWEIEIKASYGGKITSSFALLTIQ